MMGEIEEKDLVQWFLSTQKQGLPVGREIIIQKASEIHRYMFGSMLSVGLVGRGWCDRFMSFLDESTLRTVQVIKRTRNKVRLEGLQSFFCKPCQHIINRTI